MKLFECQSCGQLLYFENSACLSCGHRLGYLPDLHLLSALEPDDAGRWRALAAPEGAWVACANSDSAACNWLVSAGDSVPFCAACRLNRTIPDLSQEGHLDLWRKLETAKRRVVYGLRRLGLPVVGRDEDPKAGLAFDFLADPAPGFRETAQVMTGHAEGLITLNIAEADDAEREQHRQDMAEPYRTLVGHFRHEIGHHYWERLVRDGGWLAPYRARFGDERADYGDALAAHYEQGPPPDWAERHVSAYAASHPWEDWAESWAHYLHIVYTLDTANALRIAVAPRAGSDPELSATIDFDAYTEADFDVILRAWLPLTYAVNSLNRAMGLPDLYPFVLAPAVVEKLRFDHDLIGATGAGRRSGGT
jgi:hypothetical protein